MYARELPDGEGGTRELTFGVSGKLIMNALVMYDRETDTLWSQFLGRAVSGPLEGTALEPVGVSLTTWREWRTLHPDTLVLDQSRRRGDAYGAYYARDDAGILGESVRDARLPGKEFVLGVQRDDGFARAYPFRALSDEPVVNDELPGGPAVVVAFDPAASSGRVFDRTVDRRALTFERAPPGERGAAIRDRESGTLWSAISGEALEGPLVGQRLAVVPSFAVFWFAWTDFHPDTELFDGVPLSMRPPAPTLTRGAAAG